MLKIQIKKILNCFLVYEKNHLSNLKTILKLLITNNLLLKNKMH